MKTLLNRIKTPIPDFRKTSALAGATVVTGIRGYHQMDRYSCGPAAVHTVARALNLPRTTWGSIDPACPVYGMDTKTVRRNLSKIVETYVVGNRALAIRNALNLGNVIVCTTALPWQRCDETHWVVVAGYRDDQVLVLNYTGLPGCTKRWISMRKIDGPTLTVCCTSLPVAFAAGMKKSS